MSNLKHFLFNTYSNLRICHLPSYVVTFDILFSDYYLVLPHLVIRGYHEGGATFHLKVFEYNSGHIKSCWHMNRNASNYTFNIFTCLKKKYSYLLCTAPTCIFLKAHLLLFCIVGAIENVFNNS